MVQNGTHGPRGPFRAPRARAPAPLGAARCLALVAIVSLLSAASARAQDVCEAAARMASEAHGVPLDVMRAITRVETGRGRGEARRGWPWSANADGRSHHFGSLEEALAFAASPEAHRASNVDLGCFQISRRWHGENFANDREMLDPARNALYAARLLAGHHARLGDWTRAAGAYHSRTEIHASRYRKLFAAELAALGPAPDLGPGLAPDLGPVLVASDPGLTPGPAPSGGSLLIDRLPMPSAPIPVRAPARGGGGGVFTRVAGLAPSAAPEPDAEVQLASFEPDAPLDLDAPLDAVEPLVEPRAAREATPLHASARPLVDGAGGGAPGSLVPASSGAGPLTGGGNGPLLNARGWGG